MIRCEQTQADILNEIHEAEEEEAAARGDVVLAVATPTRTADLSFSGRGTRVAVVGLLAEPALQKMAERLEADGIRWVTVNETE